ncbi:MAG: DUF2804 domain-containing protein [Leptospira sp.]|nr:DUF2804 domain-containing protein [Leptospira sp.]
MPEIKKQIPLLNQNGTITEEGWARFPHWIYNRESIAAPKWRIKEWDYYSILSPKQNFGITLTASDLGYVGLFAICFLDFQTGSFRQIDSLKILPLGKTNFPKNCHSGEVKFSDKKIKLHFVVEPGKRSLKFESDSFLGPNGEKGIRGEILLKEPKMDSMTIATSWKENRKAFYYNTKINCMPASGTIQLGNKVYKFQPKEDFGALDWGRGVWTYKNRWFWSSLSTTVEGKPLGLNLGYGFTDRTPASENVIIYNGKIHKLDEVFFRYNAKDYMAPWKILSNDGRLNLDFSPIVDRKSYMNFLVIKSDQHQVFGNFSGKLTLDNGKVLNLKNTLGFAEDVLNWY